MENTCKLLEIKNNKQFKIKHIIYKNNKGELIVELKKHKKFVDKLVLNYRHVNQSVKWRKKKIFSKDKFIVKISRLYNDNKYPIKYYFEFNWKNNN